MVGFWKGVKLFYVRAFDFQGRSTRAEFWWSVLYQILYFFVPLIFIGLIGAQSQGLSGSVAQIANMTAGVISLLWIVGHIIHIIPGIAVSVRRLHDTDRSGWMYLISLLPLCIFFLIAFYCTDGTIGDNLYGPDPTGRGTADIFN